MNDTNQDNSSREQSAPNDSAQEAAPSSAPGAESSPPSANPNAFTYDQVKMALRKVKDPELGLNIVDLGLVYEIMVDGKDIQIDMTLTSPGCPAGPQITGDAERVLKALPGVGEVTINIVWSPYWTPEKIEPRVRAYMGL